MADSQLIVRMQPPIPHSMPHLRDEYLAPLVRPVHDLRQEEQAEPLQAAVDEHLHIRPDLLHLAVGGPRVHRQPELALDDVDEARLVHEVVHARADGDLERLAEPVAGLLEDGVPAVQDVPGILSDDVGMCANV